MTQVPKASWYLVDGEARFWDGDNWLDFVWTNPPGSYDFPNGHGFWNGEIFTSYDYVDSNNKRHQLVNPRIAKNLSPNNEILVNQLQDEITMALSSKKGRRKFYLALRFRYFLNKAFVYLGVLALISILFDPGDWMQAVGSWLFLWLLAYLIEPKY